LELKTINNGKSLIGQFYSNDESIIKDEFIIEKSSSSVDSSAVDETFDDNIAPHTNPYTLKEIAYKNK